MAHTKDIGIAIRDALELMTNNGKNHIETFDWENVESGEVGQAHVEDVDASDANNLRLVMANGEQFRISIIRE